MKILRYFNYWEFPDGNHRIREELSSYGRAGDEIKNREAPDKNGRVGMSGLTITCDYNNSLKIVVLDSHSYLVSMAISHGETLLSTWSLSFDCELWTAGEALCLTPDNLLDLLLVKESLLGFFILTFGCNVLTLNPFVPVVYYKNKRTLFKQLNMIIDLNCYTTIQVQHPGKLF